MTCNEVDLRDGTWKARFQTYGSKETAGAKYTDAEGRMRTQGMYPDRTLDGMLIGMRTMMTLGSGRHRRWWWCGAPPGSTDGHVYAVRQRLLSHRSPLIDCPSSHLGPGGDNLAA